MSVLAVVEAVLAVALAVWVYARFDTLRHVAFGVCVAPLLLLRTNISERIGTKTFSLRRKIIKEKDEGAWTGLRSLSLLLVEPTIIRVFATVYAACRAPLKAVTAIPKNWTRSVLAIDSTVPPELLPGLMRTEPDLTWQRIWNSTGRQGLTRVRGIPNDIVIFGLVYGPALVYRWSLKATSIVYTPLLFLVWWNFRVRTTHARLRLMLRSDLTRILAIYSAMAFSAFVAKCILYGYSQNFASWWNRNRLLQFFAIYIEPLEVPRWQIAVCINAILSFVLILFAREALRRYDLAAETAEIAAKGAVEEREANKARSLVFSETLIDRVVKVIGLTRWSLTMYTLACTIYLTLNAAKGWPWPRLGSKWVPWQ